ncbi:MAG: hypothetical protein ACHP8A_09090 [Terriglobales bacterium]
MLSRPCSIWQLMTILFFVVSASSQDNHRGSLWKQELQAAIAAANSNDLQSQIAHFSKLHAEFPENSRVLRNLAWAQAKAGKSDDAKASLQVYAQMGMTLQPGGPIYPDMARRGILDGVPQLADNRLPFSHGMRVLTLPEQGLIAEDIAIDTTKRRFFITSARKKKIVRCDLEAKCEDVVISTPREVFDGMLAIHVDAKRKLLWATTSGMPMQEGFEAARNGHSALLKFDLLTFRLLKRYEPSDGKEHALGDMTVASSGDVYVSDGKSGDVYVVKHGSDQLQQLVDSGIFVSPQTPALNGDESLLYVADYSEGIAIISLKTQQITWMRSRTPQALEGIDGMYWAAGRLIAVQNGTMPERIVRFVLEGNDLITRSDVMEANWEGLGDPTHGVVVGKDFYFIVNSGWDRVGEDGSMGPGKPAEVWKLPLAIH